MLFGKSGYSQPATGEVALHFSHIANGKPIIFRDSSYRNPFDENYKLTRLKYYISNIYLGNSQNTSGKNVFLVDAGETDSIMLNIPEGKYNSLVFTLGVDSILNCSGAQTGALDPLQGMFWTWNSGYIFFKLEGSSPSSTADLNRIEHHIGGYHGQFKTQRNFVVQLEKPLVIERNGHYKINLQLDLDKYWRSVHEIKIAGNPIIMIPGALAKLAADNFEKMFSILSVQ
jgi:hypothetical protein